MKEEWTEKFERKFFKNPKRMLYLTLLQAVGIIAWFIFIHVLIFIFALFILVAAIAKNVSLNTQDGQQIFLLVCGIIAVFFFVFLLVLLIRQFPKSGDKPNGILLKRNDLPELFDMLDFYTKRLKFRRVRRVYLHLGHECSARFPSLLSLLPFWGTTLELGFPVMLAHTTREFEIRLLNAINSSFGKASVPLRILKILIVWVYQISQIKFSINRNGIIVKETYGLSKAIEEMGQKAYYKYTVANHSFQRFPDNHTDDFHGEEVFRAALLHEGYLEHFLGHVFWKQKWNQSAHLPTMPTDVLEQLEVQMNEPLSPKEQYFLDRWLNSSVTEYWRESPTIKDRLGRFKEYVMPETHSPPYVPYSYFLQLPEEIRRSLKDKLTAHWITTNTKEWQIRHRDSQRNQRLVVRLRKLPQRTERQDWVITRALVEECDTREQTIQLLSSFLAVLPKHPAANLSMGHYLLEPELIGYGEYYLRRAAEHPSRPGMNAIVELYRYHKDRENKEEMEKLSEAYSELKKRVPKDSIVETFQYSDIISPHDLEPEELEVLADGLMKLGGVKGCWVAKRLIPDFPQYTCYVAVVKLKASGISLDQQKQIQTWRDKLSPIFREPTCIIIEYSQFPSDHAKARKQIRQFANSLVYTAGRKAKH